MQDSYSGQMRDISPFMPPNFAELPKMDQRNALQAACDKVQPDRTKQGPVFTVGETLEIRGGKFKITRIELGHLRLKSLPLAILVALLFCTGLVIAQDVDEHPMRAALERWHEFYHTEIHKTITNNPALGMYLTDGMEMGANTRSMQLRYFDRKVCRLFAAISNAPTASNFVWQIDQWTTNSLPDHP